MEIGSKPKNSKFLVRGVVEPMHTKFHKLSRFGHVQNCPELSSGCPDMGSAQVQNCPEEPGPGWGPHGPIWALMGPYGPSWTGLGRSGHVRFPTFGRILHALDSKFGF